MDAEGRPLVVYHGTLHGPTSPAQLSGAAIEEFSVEGRGKTTGAGAFFTASPDAAMTYSGKLGGGTIYPVYLRLESPITLDAKGAFWNDISNATVLIDGKPSRYTAQTLFGPVNTDMLGFKLNDSMDGAIIHNVVDLGPRARIKPDLAKSTIFIIKDPNSIKSATGNEGAFSSTDASIIADLSTSAQPEMSAEDTEVIQKIPSLKRALESLNRQYEAGMITAEQFVQEINKIRDEATRARKQREAQKEDLERGVWQIKKRLAEEVQRGRLSEDLANLLNWFLDQNPSLAKDLAISIREDKSGERRGEYDPFRRIMRLFKDHAEGTTGVYELLHHLERMMPEEVQDAIRQEWAKRIAAERKNVTTVEQENYLNNILRFHYAPMSASQRKALLKKTLADLVEGINNGTIPENYYQFATPSEFWAVNGSEIVQGRYDAVRGGVLTRLKNWLKELAETLKAVFGFASDAPIIKALNSLAKADGEFVSDGMLAETEMEFGTAPEDMYASIRTERELNNAYDDAKEVMRESDTGDELRESANILASLRDPDILSSQVRAAWNSSTKAGRAALGKLITTDLLVDMAKEDIPELVNTQDLGRALEGMTKQMLAGGAEIVKAVHRGETSAPGMAKKLSDVAFTATIMGYDPANPDNPVRQADMDRAYKALSPEAKEAYVSLRDYYRGLNRYRQMLTMDQLSVLPIDSEAKDAIRLRLRAMFEAGDNIDPYLPLMRFGTYWVRIGKPDDPNRKFFLCETSYERDRLVDELAKKEYPSMGREAARDRMEALKDMAVGDGFSSMTKSQAFTDSKILPEIFKLLENTEFATPEDRTAFADEIYQLYLHTLPEVNARKRFMHRENIAGFSTDLLQTTIAATTQNARQIARLKYSIPLRNSLSQARSSIENRTELAPFIDEMQERVQSMLNPPEHGKAHTIANAINRTTFAWTLTAPATALVQPTAVLVTGLPVLATEHGWTAVLAEMTKSLAFWKYMGVAKTNFDGSKSKHAPSLQYAKGLTPVQRRAIKIMMDKNVMQSTVLGEMYGFQDSTTEGYGSPWYYTKQGLNMFFGGLLHHTERLTREYMAFTAFNLNYAKAMKAAMAELQKTKQTKNPEAVQRAKEEAFNSAIGMTVTHTNEALSDPSEFNRPLMWKTAPGRVLLMLKFFPLYIMSYMITNAKRMLVPVKGTTRRQAATKMFGMLGMVWLLSGVQGMPFAVQALGMMLNAAWKEFWDEEEGDDEELADLRSIDAMLYFRNVYLPSLLGNVSVGGVKVGEDLTDIVDRGLFNYITGWDIAAKTGLQDIVFRDPSGSVSSREGLTNYIIAMAGPAPALVLRWADAYDAFSVGDYQKGMELAVPAVLRGPVIAERYAEEGVLTTAGARILAEGALTHEELVGQMLGFRPDSIVRSLDTAYVVNTYGREIANEWRTLAKRLRVAVKYEADDRIENTMEDMGEFMRKYPGYVASWDGVIESVVSQQQAMVEALGGVQLTDKNVQYGVDAIEYHLLRMQAKEDAALKRLQERKDKEANEDYDLLINKKR